MTTENYFKSELHVHFTSYELHTIMEALATESRTEKNVGNINNAKEAWRLREKVKEFTKIYDNSAVL